MREEGRSRTLKTQQLGTIVCRHCGRIIDELDTDRVAIIYSQCKQDDCTDTESMGEE